MSILAALNVLLVGVWVGMYLFTTFVVSPAFKEVFPDAAQRHASRRLVGRYYARVNGPLTAAMLVVVIGQGLTAGWNAALASEVALLVLIGGLVTMHVRRAREVAPPAWIANATLTASMLLCAASVVAA